MNRKFTLFLLSIAILFTLVIPTNIQAESDINAGIVTGIWLSKIPFFDGENITIFTAFQNQSGQNMEGIIEFFDNDSLISEQTFNAENGDFITSQTGWQAVYGNHIFKIRIKSLNVIDDEGNIETIQFESEVNGVASKEFFCDYDTDGDQVGNEVDEDDDNDGLLDEDDEEPLVAQNNSEGEKESINTSGLKNGAEKVLGRITDKINSGRSSTISALDGKVSGIQDKISSLENEISNLGEGDTETEIENATARLGELKNKKFEKGLYNTIKKVIENNFLFYSIITILIFLIIKILRKIMKK